MPEIRDAAMKRALVAVRTQDDTNRVVAAYLRTIADKIERGDYVTDENEAAVIAAMSPDARRSQGQ